MIEQIKAIKAMLGIFKDGKLHTIVATPGATTFYSSAIYTHVEADDIETLLEGKPTPTVDKLGDLFPEKVEEEIEIMYDMLEVNRLSE